jgi:hypothetical protein
VAARQATGTARVARDTGEKFGPAWVRTVDGTLAEIIDPADRRSWRAALYRTEETWQRAHDRAPVEPVDHRLEFVHAERDLPASGRICDGCGGAIAATPRPRARFCSEVPEGRCAAA